MVKSLGSKMGAAIDTVPPRIEDSVSPCSKPRARCPKSFQSITMRRCQNIRGGNNVESRECASGTLRGSQCYTVTVREVKPSNFSNRVFKWFGNKREDKPTEANYIGNFTSENGAGAKSAVGGYSQTVAIGVGWKNIQLLSCQTHHVDISPQEDRSGTNRTLGEVQGCKQEGGLEQGSLLRRVRGRLIVVHCFACNRSPMAIGRHEMDSLAEAALVIVVMALAIRNRTLKKEKELLFKQLCGMRDRGDRKNPELAALQAKQEIAEVPKIRTENSFSSPNFESDHSSGGRWTYESQNRSCPNCGSTVFEMRTYGGPWEYADTHCAQCGKLIRRYDAA
jgi:hypothetical protein